MRAQSSEETKMAIRCRLSLTLNYVPVSKGFCSRHLQMILTRKLPPHMVPAQFMVVDELPKLPNLKIDRVQLEHLDAERPIEIRDRLDDPLIDEIAQIYETVLGVSGASADDNVESLGGAIPCKPSMSSLNWSSASASRFLEQIIEQRPSIRKVAQFVNTRAKHAATVGAVR